MARKTLLVDTKCHELAEHFLADHFPAGYEWPNKPEYVRRLAEEIQTAVEDWLTAEGFD